MGFIADTILRLKRQLLPTGRAFRMPDFGIFRKFNEGVILSEEKAYQDGQSIYDSIFPDNDNFQPEDATAWERALGLIINPDSDIEDRKLAIKRKLNHPGTIKPRENYRYMERELRNAGFDVYVFENRFDDGMGGYETKSPEEVALSPFSQKNQHGFTPHGPTQHGQTFIYKIANFIEPALDLRFNIGDNLRSTFFISSDVLGLNAVIPAERETEFRKLVLTLKPVQTVAFAFVDIVQPTLSTLKAEDGSDLLLEDGSPLLTEKGTE